MRAMPERPKNRAPFSERDFYLAEFHGRTLAIVLSQQPALDERSSAVVAEVLRDLANNGTRVILLGDDSDLLASLTSSPTLEAAGPHGGGCKVNR